MPKIRDLGINVIPQTMRPPEIGPGGGCNAGTYGPDCPTTTFPTTNCPTTTFPTTNCPTTTFPTTNCPTTTFPTTPFAGPGYGYTCPGTTFTFPSQNCYPNYPNTGQTCPGTTFPMPSQNCYAANAANAANVAGFPCPGTTFTMPSHNCYQQQGLSREAIEQLKHQLQQQIAQLDEYAKNVGPRTAAEIEAREAQLQGELEELARRKKELKDRG